jgi:two-component system, chemotaxis family, CheB/CheR fusion protein
MKEGPLPRLRVLVVDDCSDTVECLSLLLGLWGHSARTARDGWEALDVARVYRPEVVLLDIGLPGLDGYQVAERLRRQAVFMPTLLVAVTGYGREEDVRRSAEAGFDLHLVKPVAPEDLRELLAAFSGV